MHLHAMGFLKADIKIVSKYRQHNRNQIKMPTFNDYPSEYTFH